MSWIDKMLGKDHTAAVAAASQKPDQVAKNIRRFELALEQCTKGADRKRELKRNLAFWRAIEQAQSALEEK